MTGRPPEVVTERLRLWVGVERRPHVPGRWVWEVTGPDEDVLDRGHAATHAEALVVGLAALSVAAQHPATV